MHDDNDVNENDDHEDDSGGLIVLTMIVILTRALIVRTIMEVCKC